MSEELPDYISNILLFAPDGSNIGISWNSDRRFYAGDRAYFQQVIAGQRLAIGDVIRTKLTGEWVVTSASPVKDQTGRLRAVIAIGTKLDRFQDALLTEELDPGLFRKSGPVPEEKEARIEQFVELLRRAIGSEKVQVTGKKA